MSYLVGVQQIFYDLNFVEFEKGFLIKKKKEKAVYHTGSFRQKNINTKIIRNIKSSHLVKNK